MAGAMLTEDRPTAGEAMNPTLKYQGGYKYQVYEDYTISVDIRVVAPIDTPFIRLDDGMLLIRKGYAWDGPSGPAIDTQNFMVGSLVHDALYQLMREGHLSQVWRKTADEELVRLCAEDGMWALRRKWVYDGVRLGGGPAARDEKLVLTAP
mgnify:CR=1 FL=1